MCNVPSKDVARSPAIFNHNAGLDRAAEVVLDEGRDQCYLETSTTPSPVADAARAQVYDQREHEGHPRPEGYEAQRVNLPLSQKECFLMLL